MLTTNIGYKHIQVPCVSFTRDLGQQAISACGLTWHINDISKLDSKGVGVLMRQLIEGKTSPKIMEAAKVSFIFRDISRICLARLTRDQCEAINSESQATPAFDSNMELKDTHVARRTTIPLNIALNEEYLAEYKGILDMIEAFQLKLEDANFAWAPDIRYIGTMGTQISIFMQFNARQFIAACNRRFINSINDEDNYAYRKALASLKQEIAKAVAGDQIDSLTQKLWEDVVAKCDPKSDYSDVLFGSEFKRKDVPLHGDYETSIYKRDQAAWAYELVRIKKEEPELLLRGESEMIDEWLKTPGKLLDYAKSLS